MPELALTDATGLLRQQPNEPRELLAFVCNQELYAVPLRSVQEIVVPPPITSVPRAPYPVLGVCSVRGQLVTVLDLRTCLGFERWAETPRTRILLGRTESDELMGLFVDEVRHVVRLGASDLEMTSQALGGDISEVVRGIGRPAAGEEMVLLDMRAIFAKGVR